MIQISGRELWLSALALLLMGVAAPALAQEAATATEEAAAATSETEPAESAEAEPAMAEPAMAEPAMAEEPAAEEEPAAPPTIEDVKKVADNAVIAANNAWMLTSSALVLFMTAPGLAMFYGGLVRKKNVLSVMMQCLFMMGMMTVIWALYGYSLAFGVGNKYIGDDSFLFMKGVAREWDATAGAPTEPMFVMAGATLMPMATHMLFQGMFFIITPALICGAFAERMKFSAMALFMILWGTLVYCPLCHWVWGGGMLAFGVEGSLAGGALDFAGGTVVHISSGISALVCALMIGKRIGFGSADLRPHNLTYTAIGAGMLWVGWFGFNAGSELACDHLTSSAFATTHFAAAAGAISWAAYEYLVRGKPSVLGAASGCVAGLVCITPAAGFVNLMPALAMGAIAGVVCAWSCSTLKKMFGYDDALDAFGVHGIGGTLGAILTGVFASRACWNIAAGEPLGLIEGGKVITGQLAAVGVTWVYSIIVTAVLLKIVDVIVGIRVTEEQERRGLDISDHEEEGYLLT